MKYGSYWSILYLIVCLFSISQTYSFISGSYLTRNKGYKALHALKDKVLELSEENVLSVLQEIREELGTIFGYDAKSREVGITGEIEFADIDGPVVMVALKGRFWHATDTVMLRVQSYLRQRIPGKHIF